MKNTLIILLSLALSACQAQSTSTSIQKNDTVEKKYNDLTPQEERVLVHKATDRPFTGDYYTKKDVGLYICRRCNNPLYQSEDKFDSHCGWPSFDDEIAGAVKRVPDADGSRTEIICMNCGGHLGHVFLGEGFTEKETRHCVNTSSLRFVPQSEVNSLPKVIK